LIGNTVYQLHDSWLQSISNKQWETNQCADGDGQELAAKKLGLNKSSGFRVANPGDSGCDGANN